MSYEIEYGVGVGPLVGRTPEFLREWRSGALRCSCGCGQRIAPGRPVARHRGTVFHRDHAPTRRSKITRATTTPFVIGRLSGVACPFNEVAWAPMGNGARQLERFKSGCFRDVRPALVELRVGHQQVIRPRFTRIAEDGGMLRFDVDVFNSLGGSQVLSDVRSGRIRHCSVGFEIRERRLDQGVSQSVRDITSAHIREISLVRNGQPVCWDTSVRVVE